jgi:acyl-CoA thioester hydrolase
MYYESSLVTRFSESDLMGHISNVSYFIYFEVARTNFLSSLEITKADETWAFVVASLKCDYKQQTYVNQTINLRTQVQRIGSKSLSLVHHILSEDEELLAIGEEVLVRFNHQTQKSEVLEIRSTEVLKEYLL